jgi:glycosyltransferase involved in cell wall biosynthesis
MEVLHISFSRTGGAGEVAAALNQALQELGHKSTLKTITPRNLRESPLVHPLLAVLAGIDRFLVQSLHSPTLFSAFRARVSSSRLEKAIIASSAEIVHLHWISGVLSRHSIERIQKSGKKIVWTFHDTAPFTGGCHQNFGCDGFLMDCKNCPQVRPFFSRIPTKNLQLSKAARLSKSDIVYVAPSRWLADKAARSSLLKMSNIEVVPNPVRQEFYGQKSAFWESDLLKKLDNVALLVANDLSDPNKNVSQLVEMVSQFNSSSNQKINLLLVGKGGKGLNSPSQGVYNLGPKSSSQLAQIMRSVRLNLMVSSAESFSLTTAEALATGCFPIVRSGTAAAELIQDGITGSTFDSYDELFDKWRHFARNTKQSATRHINIDAERFKPVNVAIEYVKLYGELIAK